MGPYFYKKTPQFVLSSFFLSTVYGGTCQPLLVAFRTKYLRNGDKIRCASCSKIFVRSTFLYPKNNLIVIFNANQLAIEFLNSIFQLDGYL